MRLRDALARAHEQPKDEAMVALAAEVKRLHILTTIMRGQLSEVVRTWEDDQMLCRSLVNEIEHSLEDALPCVDGCWPLHCDQRAFIEGVRWAVPEADDRMMQIAEEEVISRYGQPSGQRLAFAGWLRVEHEGAAVLDPLFVLGGRDPSPGLDGGATYRHAYIVKEWEQA